MSESEYFATWERVFLKFCRLVRQSEAQSEASPEAKLSAAQAMTTSAMIALGDHDWTVEGGSSTQGGRQTPGAGGRQEPAKPPPVRPPAQGEPMPWETGPPEDPSGFDPGAEDDDIPF